MTVCLVDRQKAAYEQQTLDLSGPDVDSFDLAAYRRLRGDAGRRSRAVPGGPLLWRAPGERRGGRPLPFAGLAARPDVLRHVLGALVAILLLGRWLGKLFVYFGQPRVIGEIVAGIMLGRRCWAGLVGRDGSVLPAEVAGNLGNIAQIGVILYMFLVGLEFNAGLLPSRGQATVTISHASIFFPFAPGTMLALWLYPTLAPPEVPFTSFALFIGVAMSITAFPVLAPHPHRPPHREHGAGCRRPRMRRAADDVTAWCLLAFVVGIAQSKSAAPCRRRAGDPVHGADAGGDPAAGEPLLGPRAERQPPRRMAVWVLVSLLLSALVAEWIGIHAIFGAFLLGAIIPHDAEWRSTSATSWKTSSGSCCCPRSSPTPACGRRSASSALAKPGCSPRHHPGGHARQVRRTLSRLVSPVSIGALRVVGVLMNTRGLMELIVLNIGLELGVISEKLFAMMVIMALVTTLATTPILHFLTSARPEIA